MSILGPFAVLAIFEWFLWLSCFSYCLAKTYQKADHWTSKVLSGVMLFSFFVFRYDGLLVQIFAY